jgi:glycosyltransferase involved in cell wall biosynthesis
MMRVRGDEQVSVWSRGVDRTLFDPARRNLGWRRAQGIGNDEVSLLFFGRLVLEKGVDVFAATVRALDARGVPVRPLAVGEGPARAAFEALPGAVLTGHLQGEPLARAVASADIMLTPSTTETFGNVVLEAMASGLAVISADAPSARGLIEHGRTGLLCPPLDVPSYAEAVARLARSRDDRLAMGAAARAASAGYSWDAASQSVLDAYRAVLALKSLP